MKYADIIIPSNNENSGEGNLFKEAFLFFNSCKRFYCPQFKIEIKNKLWYRCLSIIAAFIY